MHRKPLRVGLAGLLAVLSFVALAIFTASPGQAAPAHTAASPNLTWVPGDIWSAVSRSSGLCIDIANASQARGTAAIQYTCTGGTNQEMQESYAVGNAFALRFLHSGQCLEVRGASHDNGASVEQWPCTGNNNQLWYYESMIANPGRAWLRNVESNKCIDIPYDSRTIGVALQQFTCRKGDTSYDNQIWDRLAVS